MKLIYYWLALSLAAFIPLVFDIRFEAILSTELPRKALQSTSVYLLSIASLSSVLTAMMELVLDCVSKDVPEFMDYRFLSLLGLGLFEVICIATKDSYNAPTIFTVTSYWHLLTEVILGASLLNELCPKIFTWTRVLIPCIFFVGAVIIVFITSLVGDTYPFLGAIYLLCLYLFQSTLFFLVFLWLYEVHKDFRKSNLSIKVYFKTVLEATDHCLLLLILLVGSELLVLINVVPYVCNASFALQSTVNETAMLAINTLRYSITMTCYFVPGRIFREKSIRESEKLKITKSMVQYMQHEMRNPVSAIQMGVTNIESTVACDTVAPLALTSRVSSSTVKSFIPEMRESIVCIKDLLDDMLLYESLHSRSCRLDQRSLDVASFVVTSFESYQTIASRLNVDFSVLSEDHYRGNLRDAIMSVDRKKLELAFRPFLLSAIGDNETSRPKRVNFDVELVVRHRRNSLSFGGSRDILPEDTPNSDIHFIVTDFDSGESEVEVRKLMENACFQREARRDRSSSGLGWWISREIISLHRGSIKVSQFATNDGRVGIKYDISLPAVLPLESEEALVLPQRVEPRRHIAASDYLHTNTISLPAIMHILVVDDSKLNRKMLLRMMVNLGHTCEEACDGIDAVKMVEESMSHERSRFDAILLDNEMPIMKGVEAIQRIRDMGYDGLVLGVTGNALQEDQDEFVRRGVDMVVLKPMDADDFHRALREVMSRPTRWRQPTFSRL